MKGKHTTKINGYLIDVTEEYHKKYRPEESRHTYLKKQEKNVEIVSLEGLAKDEIRGMDVIAEPNVNVEEEVIKKVLLSKLAEAKEHLSGDERLLIDLFYDEEKTQDEISMITGIPQTTVSYRLKKVIEKLREIMGVKKIWIFLKIFLLKTQKSLLYIRVRG